MTQNGGHFEADKRATQGSPLQNTQQILHFNSGSEACVNICGALTC